MTTEDRGSRASARPASALREPGLLGIVGSHVNSSLSPAMHAAALRRLRVDARYLAFEIAPDQLRDVVRALRPLGFWGLNVTIPYKEAVLRHLDRLDPEAAAIGAVNTVVVGPEGLAGHNTDAPGFLRALQDAGGSVSYAEPVETSQISDLMVDQVAEGLDLLASSSGQYQMKDGRIHFTAAGNAARYGVIQSWVSNRRQQWAAIPASTRPETITLLLKALGDGLPTP